MRAVAPLAIGTAGGGLTGSCEPWVPGRGFGIAMQQTPQIYVYIYIFIFTFMYIYIYTYKYIYVYVYDYLYICLQTDSR